jgi:hypothetical protein
MSFGSSGRMVAERTTRQVIGMLTEQRLMRRLGPAERVDADPVRVQKDVGSDQSTDPMRRRQVGTSQQFDDAAIVGASQVDDAADGMGLQIERPRGRKNASCRSGVRARRVTTPSGGDVTFGASLKFLEGGGAEALDDLALPESVERFDGGLEAGLARRREDGSDAQSEAKADDASHGIGKIMGALKARVVVELSVGGQAVLTPMGEESLEDEVGGDVLTWPGIDETAMKRNGIEAVSVSIVLERDGFHDVEGVELDAAIGEIGKIPSGRRSRTAHASSSIENAVAGEDAADGSDGGKGRNALFLEMAMNGLIAEFAEIAVQPQMRACVEDARFEIGGNASSSSGSAGPVIEIDAFESLGSSASDPTLNGAQRDADASRDLTQGESATREANDLMTKTQTSVFWPRERLQEFAGNVAAEGSRSRAAIAGGRNVSRPTASFRRGPQRSPMPKCSNQ